MSTIAAFISRVAKGVTGVVFFVYTGFYSRVGDGLPSSGEHKDIRLSESSPPRRREERAPQIFPQQIHPSEPQCRALY